MKLTMREKVFLIVLSTSAVLFLGYLFMIKPQLEKTDELTIQKTNLQLQVDKVNTEIALIKKIDDDIKIWDDKIQVKSKRFFPAILQDKILLILNNLLVTTQLKSNNIDFNQITIASVKLYKPTEGKKFPVMEMVDQYKSVIQASSNTGNNAQVESDQSNGNELKNVQKDIQDINEVESMSVLLQIDGNYGQIMSFIKGIEALDRTTIVRNINITYNEQDLLSGSIQVDFYALPKLHDQDAEYFNWPFKGTYGKINPFIPGR